MALDARFRRHDIADTRVGYALSGNAPRQAASILAICAMVKASASAMEAT